MGMPDGYLLGERIERAYSYAKERNMRVFDILLSWWLADERNAKGKGKAGRPRRPLHAHAPDPHDVPKSYDLDEFFEAALKRGLRELPPT